MRIRKIHKPIAIATINSRTYLLVVRLDVLCTLAEQDEFLHLRNNNNNSNNCNKTKLYSSVCPAVLINQLIDVRLGYATYVRGTYVEF